MGVGGLGQGGPGAADHGVEVLRRGPGEVGVGSVGARDDAVGVTGAARADVVGQRPAEGLAKKIR